MIRSKALYQRILEWLRPASAQPRPQRILITQRELKNFGGSELFAIEIARALKSLGREVAIYCPSPGKLSNIVTPSGIPVCETLDAVPFRPDIIHGQHHLPTMAALAHFPDVPAIYCWHGARPWVEQSPVHPRIRYHVVTSIRMGPRLSTEFGMPSDRVVTIPNFVDLQRFSRVRKVSGAPTRAVLYGQAGFHPGELAQLERSCAENGLALDKVCPAYGNPRPRPEYFLPDYDVAFAIGRCAIEALACGCAVMPIVPQLAGALVTTQNLDDWADSNFSPRYFTSADVMDSKWLAGELARITPEALHAVTQSVRTRHAMEHAVAAFMELYERTIIADAPRGSGAEFAHYLGQMAPQMDAMWGELECRKVEDIEAQTKIRALEQKNDEANQRIQRLTDRLLSEGKNTSD